MPICPNCGSQQPDGAAFCDECGARLEEVAPAAAPAAGGPPQYTPTTVVTTCPVCGASVKPGEPFCDNCGAALGQATPTPPPQAAAPSPPAPEAGAETTCSNCGARLEPGSNFCDMCGAPVSAAEPAPTPAPSPPQPAPAPVSEPEPAPPPPPKITPKPAPEPAPQPTPTPKPPQPVQPPMTSIPGQLVVESTNATLPFPPGRTEVFVGREDPVSGIFPEIDLTDHGGDEGGVSRRHARIFVRGSQVLIEDLNSTNYTHVNQQRLTPGQPHPLESGDELRLGRVKLKYHV